MPAVRFYYRCGFSTVDHTPATVPVEVRLNNGSFAGLNWFGFVCQFAAESLPGCGYCKIRAYEVTAGDGLSKCSWKSLKKNEYVLGWKCISSSGDLGVYGVVDVFSCPIIVSNDKLICTPRLKTVV